LHNRDEFPTGGPSVKCGTPKREGKSPIPFPKLETYLEAMGLSHHIGFAAGVYFTCVTFSTPTTKELLKRVEDMMREDWEFLKDFNAAVDQLQKKQEKFQTEHPAFGRYS